MKLVTIIATLAILCAVVFAQQPQPTPSQSGTVLSANLDSPALPENYVLTLAISDKEQLLTDFTLVVATADFKANFAYGKSLMVNFIGKVILEEGGAILIRYAVANERPVSIGEGQYQHKTSTTISSVRLRLGESVQISKSDLYSCRLSISRLADQGSKPK